MGVSFWQSDSVHDKAASELVFNRQIWNLPR
jgi:hypothetical protein